MRQNACDECKTWEEELYWTHFQYIHFTLLLQPGFDQHLAFPEKFIKKLGRKLPAEVTLKGPSGTAWEVYITEHENALIFDHGWQEFVKDHSLQENDILVFKYNGDSVFDVLMFDGQSMCEKAGSYFLMKCVHKQHDGTVGFDTKRNPGGSAEVISTSSGDVSGGSKRKRPKCHNVYIASGRPIVSKVADEDPRKKMKLPQPSIGTRKTAKQDTCSCAKDVENGDIVHTALCLSSRRWIPEEHKLKILQMANNEATLEGLVAVMRPTYLTKKYLPLPKKWASKHINYTGDQNIILRIKDKTWKIRVYYAKNSNQGGFSYGWRKFVLDNNLKEFDVCVFEPAGIPTDNMTTLDATIFHISE